MNKQIIIITLAFLLLISLVSARVTYWQTREDEGNKTIQDYTSVCYGKSDTTYEDYIKSNKFFEGYLWYDVYVQKWNNDNPNYQMEYCNLTIKKETTIIYNMTYTDLDNDIINEKYFVQLKDNECASFNFFCKYEFSANQSKLDMPINANFVTPTWECKGCQFYLWSLIERDIIKAKAIGDNVVRVSTYIKKLILINFEIWLAIFWIFLILMIFVSVGFIFILIYYLYLYLKNIVR